MTDNKVDLILHPVRLRILVTLSGHQRTARQVHHLLPDIAQATLYRHLNALHKGGLLTVAAERPVRGTVEKVYTLRRDDLLQLTEADLQDADKTDHARYFSVFLMTLLADFTRYLNQQDNPNFAEDGVGYYTIPLYMNDESLRGFSTRFQALLQPYLQAESGAQRRLFSFVIMPATKTGEETSQEPN